MKKELKSLSMNLLKVWLLLPLLTLSGCSTIERRAEGPKKQELPALTQSKISAKIDWSKHVGSGVGKADVKLLLANTENTLVVSDAKGKVAAIDRISGKFAWEVDLRTPISAGPTVAEGKVLLGTRKAEIIALDLQTGNIIWNVSATSELLAAPAIRDGMVIIHPLDGSLAALNAENGKQVWRISLNIPSLMLRRSSSPAVTEDYVISGFASGKVVAINRLDGSVDWSQDVSVAKGRSDIQRMIDISADPIVANEVVYIVAYQGNLAAISLNSGQPLWARELSSYAGMALAGDIIYVAAVDGEVVAVDRYSGNTLWHQDQLKGRKLSKPVVYDEYIVVGDEDGILHWLSAERGELVGRLKVASQGIEAAPKVIDDALYVYSKCGKTTKVKVSILN